MGTRQTPSSKWTGFGVAGMTGRAMMVPGRSHDWKLNIASDSTLRTARQATMPRATLAVGDRGRVTSAG